MKIYIYNTILLALNYRKPVNSAVWGWGSDGKFECYHFLEFPFITIEVQLPLLRNPEVWKGSVAAPFWCMFV